MTTLSRNLVRRGSGKIHYQGCSHSSLHARPVRGTQGKTIREIVAKYGTDLCSHCFPKAQVEKATRGTEEAPAIQETEEVQATVEAQVEEAPAIEYDYRAEVHEEDGLLVVTVSERPGQYDPNALDVYAAANGEWVVTNPHSGTYRVSPTLQVVSRDGILVDTSYADHAHVVPAVRAGVEALRHYDGTQQVSNLDTSGELAADDVVQVVDNLRDRGLIRGAVVGASPVTGETIAQVADVTGKSWVLETGPFGVWTDRDGTPEGHVFPSENVWGAALAVAWAIRADRDELAATK